MKKILLACSFALMSLFCNADNHINKKDITTILFTSSNKIIFNLNNGTSFHFTSTTGSQATSVNAPNILGNNAQIYGTVIYVTDA